MRNSTAALALVMATTSSIACTVLNDMSSYSAGGSTDTGEQLVVDTGVVRDSSVPPDTGAKPDAAADSDAGDTSTTDSMVTTTMDSSPDADAADSRMEVAIDAITDVPLGCHVVINEVQTRSVAVAGDEFIELYNPCPSTIDVSGYRIVYRSSMNTTDVMIATIAAGKTMAPSSFFLIGNGSFSATADQPFTASGIADDGGAAVRDSAGTQLDSVAWGSVVSSHSFIETTPAPKPSSGASISRVPNGVDTDNNSIDFKSTSPATPKS